MPFAPMKPAHAPLSRGTAYAVFVCLVLIWGLNWPIMKMVVQLMPPIWFVVVRLALGALCLFGFLLATGRLARPTKQDWPVIWSVAILQMGLFMILTTIGLQFIPAGARRSWLTPRRSGSCRRRSCSSARR